MVHTQQQDHQAAKPVQLMPFPVMALVVVLPVVQVPNLELTMMLVLLVLMELTPHMVFVSLVQMEHSVWEEHKTALLALVVMNGILLVLRVLLALQVTSQMDLFVLLALTIPILRTTLVVVKVVEQVTVLTLHKLVAQFVRMERTLQMVSVKTVLKEHIPTVAVRPHVKPVVVVFK